MQHLIRRPAAPLHINAYEILGTGCSLLMLNELQIIKNDRGKIYAAIEAVQREFTVMLTGTIFPNR